MDLLVNDLSINGQFPNVDSFREAINRVMKMRQIAQRFGRFLYCHRNIANANVTNNYSMQQALQYFNQQERLALIVWFQKKGPFWDDIQIHNPDDYLECNGDIVTDKAVGEIGYSNLHGLDRRLVSLIPSSWEFSPITVTFTPDAGDARNIEIINYFEVVGLETDLQVAPIRTTSWRELENICLARCPDLTFLKDAFEPLNGYPFIEGASNRIIILLDTLNKFKCCFNEQGKRTAEGQQIYQDHFTGDRAWFSDSSNDEKSKFKRELTFKHPTAEGKELFCPMHAKINTPLLRIHFSWPIRADEPLFVVYIGPKITKQ